MVFGIFIIILKAGMLIIIMYTVFSPVKSKEVSSREDLCVVLHEGDNLSPSSAVPVI